MKPHERDALEHKLIHLLWELQIQDAEAKGERNRGSQWHAERLRRHRAQRMPSLSRWASQRAIAREAASL